MERVQNQGVGMRRVTAADKETVLKLRDNVHNGVDYLEAYFDFFLAQPNMYPAAIFKAERMAGFSLVHIVDDGRTAVSRAGRVAPDFEGQGLMKILFQHTAEWAGKMGVDSIVSVVEEFPGAHVERPKCLRFTQAVPTWTSTELHFDSKHISVPPADVDMTTNLATMSDGQLADILTQSKTRDYIAPKGNLLINMVPLKPKEANISCMRGIQGSTKIYSDIKTDTNDLSGLLSCCTMFGAPRDSIVAKVYFIDVFGDDPSSLRKHFTRHLVDIASNSKGMIGLNVILPECLPTSMIRQALTDANLRDDGSLSSSPVLIHLLEFWRRNECKH